MTRMSLAQPTRSKASLKSMLLVTLVAILGSGLLWPPGAAATGSDISTDLIENGDALYWDFQVPVVHSSSCDNWIPYKTDPIVTPDSDLTITLNIPMAIEPKNPVKLHYRRDYGTATTLYADPGPLQQATFTIPASQLPEGTTLDYIFEINIFTTLIGNPCTGATNAVVPTRYAFHSTATSLPLTDPGAQAQALLSLSVLHAGAGTSAGLTPDETCTKYFNTPTPCDEFEDPGSLLNATEEVLGTPVASEQEYPCDGSTWSDYGASWGYLPPYDATNPDKYYEGRHAETQARRTVDLAHDSLRMYAYLTTGPSADSWIKGWNGNVGKAGILDPNDDYAGNHDTWLLHVLIHYTLDGFMGAVAADPWFDVGSSYRAAIKLYARSAQLDANNRPIASTMKSTLLYESTILDQTSLTKPWASHERFLGTPAFATWDWYADVPFSTKWAVYLYGIMTVEGYAETGGFVHSKVDVYEFDSLEPGGTDWKINMARVQINCVGSYKS